MPHLDRRCFLEGKHLLEWGVLVFHCGYRQVQHLLECSAYWGPVVIRGNLVYRICTLVTLEVTN